MIWFHLDRQSKWGALEQCHHTGILLQLVGGRVLVLEDQLAIDDYLGLEALPVGHNIAGCHHGHVGALVEGTIQDLLCEVTCHVGLYYIGPADDLVDQGLIWKHVRGTASGHGYQYLYCLLTIFYRSLKLLARNLRLLVWVKSSYRICRALALTYA